MSVPPFNERLIEPAKLGGFGKDQSEPQGGLQGRVFRSRCPPDVAPSTRILAVCGPNDYQDNASPEQDGWMFSDFYLFHHLLKNTSPHQVWLTCVKPETLTLKYGEYAHGKATGERRIVLDQAMLPDTADIRVVDTSRKSQKNDLLERFLGTLRSECQEAIRND